MAVQSIQHMCEDELQLKGMSYGRSPGLPTQGGDVSSFHVIHPDGQVIAGINDSSIHPSRFLGLLRGPTADLHESNAMCR